MAELLQDLSQLLHTTDKAILYAKCCSMYIMSSEEQESGIFQSASYIRDVLDQVQKDLDTIYNLIKAREKQSPHVGGLTL